MMPRYGYADAGRVGSVAIVRRRRRIGSDSRSLWNFAMLLNELAVPVSHRF